MSLLALRYDLSSERELIRCIQQWLQLNTPILIEEVEGAMRNFNYSERVIKIYVLLKILEVSTIIIKKIQPLAYAT